MAKKAKTMEKAVFRKVGVTLYQGKNPQGMKYVLCPDASAPSAVFGIAVPKGGFHDEKSIDGTKIPAGAAHFLEHRMFDTPKGDGLKVLLGMGADANAFTTNSTTFYYFSTQKADVIPALDFLFDMVTEFYMSEDAVEREKPIIIGELENQLDSPDYVFDRALAQTLYFHSPLREEVIGTPESVKQTHLSTLKRFFLAHYRIQDMVFFGTGAFDADAISAYLEKKRCRNDFPEAKIEKISPIGEGESQDKVKANYVSAVSPDGQTYLGVGVKFPTRKVLYEKWGDALFAIYELLPELVSSYVLKPIDALRQQGYLIFKSGSDLTQAGEDAYFSLLFETNAPEKLKEGLTAHFDHLETALSPLGKELRAIKNSNLASDIALSGQPMALMENLIEGFENHLAWPFLASRASTLSYRDCYKFLKDMSGWPRTFVRLSPKGGTKKAD